MIKLRAKTPEREHILSSGEKIRIRQLTPSERLNCLSLSGETGFCKRMELGLVSPAISLRQAKKILNHTPFRALEILRAIQIFSREKDISEQNEIYLKQDEQFLKTLQFLESMKGEM